VNCVFEDVILNDLETSIRRVASSIQADCRVLDLIINEEGFSISVAVGENLGQPQWLYFANGSGQIHITAIEYDFWAETSLYFEAQNVTDFWKWNIQQMVNIFFENNPAYHNAISW
jgi:hypothetical protein